VVMIIPKFLVAKTAADDNLMPCHPVMRPMMPTMTQSCTQGTLRKGRCRSKKGGKGSAILHSLTGQASGMRCGPRKGHAAHQGAPAGAHP